MPSFETHCAVSRLRTGKGYAELHKWMDKHQKTMGFRHREKNHSLNDIPKVKKFFKNNPNEAVIEFLVHIIMDFQDTSSKKDNIIKQYKGYVDEKNDEILAAAGYGNVSYVPENKRIKFRKG